MPEKLDLQQFQLLDNESKIFENFKDIGKHGGVVYRRDRGYGDEFFRPGGILSRIFHYFFKVANF